MVARLEFTQNVVADGHEQPAEITGCAPRFRISLSSAAWPV
jgi:hypothetical protein